MLIISQSALEDTQNTEQIGVQDFNFNKIYYHILNSPKNIFVVVTDDPKVFLKSLCKSVNLIVAAGGLVKNKKKECLFIYRNDRWDLPKGKLEKFEKPRIGAVREVEEECGIVVYELGKKIGRTYHAYESKGEVVVKRTHWYKMKYRDGGKLKPQLEEGITEVRWFKKGAMDEILANTFPLIVEVMEKTNLIKGKPTLL